VDDSSTNVHLKFIWKHKRPRIAKVILSKKNNAGGITIPDFKLYYKEIRKKPAWYWHKNRHKEQWNRYSTQVLIHTTIPNLFLTKALKIYDVEKIASSNKSCWENWLVVCKKLKLDLCLSPCTSISSKWIKDLNIRLQTLKLVQERVGNTLELIGIGKYFLNRTPAAQQLRESIDKWDFIKLKIFCTRKEMVFKLETTHRVRENICQLHIKGLITRI
jgi:hypothetical protein